MSVNTTDDVIGDRGSAASGCPVLHHTATGGKPSSGAARIAMLAYGAVSYVLFLGVFLYAIGFVSDIVAPRTVHNMAWGGEDGRTLFLCAHDRLYRIDLLQPGVRP